MHWLSNYNYDFALAAIPIQIILMIFYSSRRNLPIRQSRSFLFVMISNLVMTVSDVVACELNEVWYDYPIALTYFMNIIYFASFICRGWTLFDYSAEVCHIYRRTGKIGSILSAVPMLIMLVMIFSTPWTNTIFAISPETGYSNCYLYSSIYVCTWFYILLSLVNLVLCWKMTTVRTRVGLISFNMILLIGIIIRGYFINTLVTSYFSIMAIIIIFLISQNPDLYRERQTGLFNREAFDVIGSEYLHKDVTFHCVIVSMHNYDTVKAIYGYNQLKRSLTLIGKWMVTHFSGYYVFYYGNGNYVLLRRGTFEDNRQKTIDLINDRFSQAWIDNDTDVSLAMSIMIMPYDVLPDNINGINDLIQYTFGEAYAENNLGHVLVGPEMLKRKSRKQEIEIALGRALEENRLEAYFQPIYSTFDKRVVGAEALARLNDPELGFISPAEFIEVAEQTGDIMEVGQQIFERVCEFAQSNPLAELGLEFININLSPAQFMNEQLVAELSEVAATHNVSMERFDFEITETAITDYAMIKKQMLRLLDHGAEVSLDDFGSGTSNLNALMTLPIHIVKIDMEVVRSYFNGETTMLPDLVRLFQNANLQIVVEGVETHEMKESLDKMGCDYQQGYFFSRPLPPEAFVEYLKKQNKRLAGE